MYEFTLDRHLGRRRRLPAALPPLLAVVALAGRHRLRAGHADGRRARALHAGRAAARRAAVALAGDPRRRRDHRHRRVHPGRHVLGAVPGQGALAAASGRRAAAARAATSRGCPSSPCSTGSPTARTRSAFPIWTFAALIAGPIWAHYAWGRYWGWDPKEVWAFITWVVYAAYLHARATSGWKGRSAAVVALVGPGDAVVQLRGDQLLLRQREPALLRRTRADGGRPLARVSRSESQAQARRLRPCCAGLLAARARAGSPRRRRGPTGPRGAGRPAGVRRRPTPCCAGATSSQKAA